MLKYRGRYEEETDYENMVIKSLPNGDVLRLKDVARVELGAENYALLSQTDGHPGANCMIAQTSGSNANEIIKEIDATAAEISTDLPKGMVLADIMSTKDFLDASIANVIETLLLAIVLVIGTVVDNAIVVVEAVQAKFDEGYSSSYRAAVDALDGLTSALVTTTIVFMAVFIPVCFMGGTTGTFYTQFGLTMAVAVAISLVNALTLSPALCALIMRPRQSAEAGKPLGFSDRFHYAFNRSFEHLLGRYEKGVSFLFRHRYLAAGSVVVACGSYTIRLKPWDERTGKGDDLNAVMAAIYRRTDGINTLAGYIGGSYSSNLNRFTKLYRVMVQAAPEYRLDREALNNIFVRNSSGEMSPISQYLTLTRVYGTESLSRFNLFSAIAVYGAPAEGYSSGQAIQAIQEVARTALPEGYGYEFGGMAREEASTGNTTTLVFTICILFIYLILCALYESLMIPFAVILSVPFGLAGSFLFAQFWGLENNIYMQTGSIMLIGLLAKTAILLTEYASTKRRQGLTITEAAMAAAKARLRPILMTSLTMIFGMLPLMFAQGVGANGNISVGVGTVGGMLLGTVALLFVVPALFIGCQTLQERFFTSRQTEE